jgi:hypothetical protein
MAHACNPNYLEGRDQEDLQFRATWVNTCETISKKILYNKRTGGVAHCVGTEFKPQYHKKKSANMLVLMKQCVFLHS